ncbi:Variant-specific surface protein [Giardia duodenalis]|uniref:Variant-specific surface protein n=1 Tax=Giardia intestinalis TaxID=5741 RepID=V6TUN5_GIAIN|nr:Variant-specific surface protein [Giardia intestinalis]
MCPSAAQSGPIGGLCRPASSPQAIVAGCAGKNGAALTDSSTACGMCSGSGFFLFRGGCYSQTGTPGSSICTAVSNGECTTCATANWLFTNPTNPLTNPGTKCILCSDATGDGTTKGVANCNTCQAPNNAGPATCSACQDGYYKDSNGACTQCNTNSCLTCETSATQCTSCPEGKYLNGNTCVDGTSNSCGANSYADKRTWTCKACSEIAGCTECAYNDNLGGPVCSTCSSPNNLVKTAIDGTTTCVAEAQCAALNTDGTHFLNQAKNKCLLCSDITTDASDNGNTGVANCKTCQKAADGTNPTCSECLDGYFSASGACTKCAANCATCTSADMSTCTVCLPGYFLKTDGSNKECVPCDNVDKGGREGCSTCSNTNAFKCTKCKPNYQQSGSSPVTCTKTCEDPTACGGTAGSCKAAVLDDKGVFHYYCSLCGDPTTFPINGLCTKDNNGNTCKDGVCTQCADGYFLYMGGCYNTQTTPGSLMCTVAAGGICTTPTGQYFKIPGATDKQQSVLACENPVGTAVGERAYVGVEDCKTCEAPTAPSPAGMAAAKCTACDGSKKPTGSGYGCVTCDTSNCKSCVADGVCGECTDSHYLKTEGSTTSCVRKEACTGGYFPKDESTGGNKCVQCSSASDGGITDCSECSLLPSASRSSTPLVTCTKCSSGNLSPLKNECMQNCPAGMYADSNRVCLACHTSCASCKDNNAESSCTACYPGHVLNRTTDSSPIGTCIPECTGRYAENCADGQCTAVLGGSKYCSKCKSGYVPVDGICVSAGTRAPPTGCTPNNDGTCSACTDTYFKESGGCYKAGAFPGNAICTTATGGSCTMCVSSGQNLQGQSCPTCPVGCSKCSGNSGSETCSECLAGYYKSGTSCVKCDKNSNGITGVPNCVSCKEPSGASGTVTCYVTQTPTVDPTDPSVNKGGLSTGAIAGISVAAVVVVGGLVGFLCWWFVCRGKA